MGRDRVRCLLVAVVAATSCSGGTVAGGGNGGGDDWTTAAPDPAIVCDGEPASPPGSGDLDEALSATVGAEFPEYAGHRFTDNGDLIVRVTDPTISDERLACLQHDLAGFLGDPLFVAVPAEVEAADHNWPELTRFKLIARGSADLDALGLSSYGIDAATGRLTIAVHDVERHGDQVLEWADDHGIPRDAVTLEEEDVVEPAVG